MSLFRQSFPRLTAQRAMRFIAISLWLFTLAGCTTPPVTRAPAAPPLSGQEKKPAPLEQDIAALLNKGRHSALRHPDFRHYQAALKAAYGERGNAPRWLDNAVLTENGKTLLALISTASSDGLSPADYDAQWLDQQAHELPDNANKFKALAQFDVGLSIAYARLLHDVHAGRVPPKDAGLHLDTNLREAEASSLVKRGFGNEAPDKVFAAARPRLTLYQQMLDVLAHYRTLAAQRTRADLPPLDKSLHPGESWSGLPAMADWLSFLGDYNGDQPKGHTYSAALVGGVKHFQQRHGIAADGVVGRSTYAALSAGLPQRVHQIELALERLRWVSDGLENQRLIVVNIPQFTLWAFPGQTGGSTLTMNVVVGSSVETNTPVLFDQVERVIFNPYWNVPTSITKKELLPKLRKDPNHLVNENMELVGKGEVLPGPPTPEQLNALARGEYRVRQRPGPWNALGHVKFEFPNRDSIYMHDTPSRGFFSRSRRDLSHGCIRLSHPEQMANYLLANQRNWSEAKVAETLSSTEQLTVELREPVPVLLFYTTALVDSAGQAVFLDDIYSYDNELDYALMKADQRQRN